MATKPTPISKDIKPFIWFFQIVGLQFFFVDATYDRNIPVKYKVYFLVLLSAVAFSCYAQIKIQPQVEQGDNAKTAVQKSLEGVVYLGVYISAFVTLFQAFLSTSKSRMVLDNFNKISNLSWTRAYFRIDYTLFRRQFTKIFIASILFFVITFALPVILNVASKSVDDPLIYRPFYTLIPAFLLKFASIKFMFYAELINYHMEMIEKLLEKPYVDAFHIIEILDNFNKQTSNQTKQKNDKLVLKISVAKQMYGMIWETTELLNRCLGWTLLMETMLVSCGLIVGAYQYFLLLQNKAPFIMYPG